jgi:aldehyde dehydrogenase (NAD+)
VVEALATRFAALRAGPASLDLDVGPLISARQLGRVRDYLDASSAGGVRLVAQGSVNPDVPRGGYYQAPVLLDGVLAGDRLFQDEIFGPVLVTTPFDDEAQAIALANDTPYGLVAGVWTRDGGRQLRMARAIRSGQVFINNYGAGGGVELPFGGVKRSGYGREKGFEALYGFTTLKTVAIKHD